MDNIFSLMDSSKDFPEGKRQYEPYSRFCEAIELGRELTKSNRFQSFEYDDPDNYLTWHSIQVTIGNNQFVDNSEIEKFTEFMNKFDEISIYAREDKIDMSCVITIYI